MMPAGTAANSSLRFMTHSIIASFSDTKNICQLLKRASICFFKDAEHNLSTSYCITFGAVVMVKRNTKVAAKIRQ